ncbi:response regulator [Robertmurraya massiliosenegalensis]|uniref:response regulator n=1 Tax=Robertmurraya massiliosenegalensis TaxID=1287657 RepID=UPI00030A214A|nr:response regulator [Robertmurraya massiliosenegalensis]
MKYTTRLYVGFGLMILVLTMIITLIVGILNIQNQDMNNLVEDRYEKIKLLNHIRTGAKNINNELNILLQSDATTKDDSIEDIRTEVISINDEINVLKEVIQVPEAKDLLMTTVSQFDTYEKTVEKIISQILYDERNQVQSIHTNANEQYHQIITVIDQLIAVQEGIMEDTLASSKSNYHLFINVSIVSILVALILSYMVSKWVIRDIRTRFRSIRDVMKSIQYGSENLPRLEMDGRDEIGEIALAYNEMAQALEDHERMEREYTEEVEEQNWLSKRLAELSMLSQEILDILKLGDTYLQEMAPMVDATYGSLYIVKEEASEHYLSQVSVYAGSAADHITEKETIKWGEGLIGQCAKDGKIKQIYHVPEDYVSISSSLGETKPNSIMIVPIHLDGDVVGVIELATLTEFSPLQEKLMMEATKQLGITIYRINQQMQVRQLLEEAQTLNEELQSQSEELQLQQEELRTMNEELEAQYRHSEQKTKDLENTKQELEERTKQLQLSSKYKSEFLANMSHELRTPLNSLLILAQILQENKEGNLTDKQEEYASTIYASGKDLLNLINDILDLTKIESGKLDVHEVPLNMNELEQFFKKQFEPMVEKKGIQFEVEIDEELPNTFHTDEQKVYQILKNLISNAIKFTERGYVKLQVQKKTGNRGETYILFKVSDTGVGISKQNQQLIFEAFQQADGTTSRKYGGTGLGLSISRELAALLNGHITVVSEEGEGSVFTFYLPISNLREKQDGEREVAVTVEEMNPQLIMAPTLLSESVQDQYLVGKKVLVVDDDMRNVFSLTTALEAVGMKVSFAENGKDGIQYLQENDDVDIVLMDIMMPEMDGYEAMRKIREDERFTDLPIVALTAKAMSHDRKKCIDSGASDYITKPVNLEQLYSLLKVWLYK